MMLNFSDKAIVGLAGVPMIGAIMFTGGLIAMLFIRPEREAERLRQDGMRGPLPTRFSWGRREPI